MGRDRTINVEVAEGGGLGKGFSRQKEEQGPDVGNSQVLFRDASLGVWGTLGRVEQER